MGQKRTPELVKEAKRLRAQGFSDATIAETLSKKGKTISKASVQNWLGRKTDAGSPPTAGAQSAHPAPQAAPGGSPVASDGQGAVRGAADAPAGGVGVGVDDGEVTPDQLRMVLSRALLGAQAAADKARADNDPAEAKAQAKLAALFAGHLRQIHSKADEDTDTVRVKAGDIEAARDRGLEMLDMTGRAVVAEVLAWPACPVCRCHAGAFGPGDKSPVRRQFELVAGAGREHR